MKTELKNNFMQATLGTIIWITLLTTLFANPSTLTILAFWKLIAIGSILGLIFGVIYPFLWNYSTFKSLTNILISTLVNSIGGLLSLYLYSYDLFSFIRPYIFGIVLLTLVGHSIGFYFYSKVENRKLARELNQHLN
ncbi:hypothetical protein ACYSNW_09265 [Enterococcus sp. LJL99]